MRKVLIGMEIEKYVGKVCRGFMEDLTYRAEELERYRLVFERGGSLNLYVTYRECSSGYTGASFGHWEWEYYTRKPFSYVPKTGPIEVEIEEEKEEENCCILVKYEDDIIASADDIGGDKYYPAGGIYLKKDFFEPTARTMPKRPVWIFKGPSGLGKSTLAAETDKKVFETDAVEQLPNEIMADIVVIGNKRQYTFETIKQSLPENVLPIIVDFSQSL